MPRTNPTAGPQPSPMMPAATPASHLDYWSGDPDFMLSLARGLLVLRTITDGSAPKSVAELARRTGLPRATARRCAHTLRELDYLVQDEWGFTAGPRLAALSSAHAANSPLLIQCRPVLDRLHRQLEQNVSIGVMDDREAMYVGRVELQRQRAFSHRRGVKVPAYCTALGRVLLADKSPALLERYLAETPFERHTDQTVTSPEELRACIEDVRRLGYSIVDQELDENLRSIAVPVRNRAGQVIAAISVGTDVTEVSFKDLRGRILPEVLSAAEELSALAT